MTTIPSTTSYTECPIETFIASNTLNYS